MPTPQDLQKQLGVGIGLGLGKAEVQTSNMNAQAYNTANQNDPGRFQIQGGTSAGSSGTIGEQKLSPASPAYTSAPTQIVSQATPSVDTISATVAPQTSIVAGSNTPTNSAGGFNNSPNLLNLSGTKAERVKKGRATYDQIVAKRNELMASDSTLGRLDALKQARKELNGTIGGVNSDPYGLNNPVKSTGISELDTGLEKIRQDKADAIKKEFQSYTIAQADYNKNKNYYTNFDATNNTFNSVLGEIQSTLSKTGSPQLSDAEAQAIAQKYGVTTDEIKNPLSIYKKLEMTDEGKQVLGLTDRENQITDLQTENERKKQDAMIQHDRNITALNQNIEDVNRDMERNVNWATASGAWAGANRSSGYQQGIQNIKDDTARVVGRIQDQINQSNTDTATYLSRLSDDLTTNITRAKTSLDNDMKSLKFDMGLKLNGLEQQYGANSKSLLKALDAIQEEFGTKSIDFYNKYLSSVKSIQSIASDNLTLIEKMNTLNDAMKNKRYGEIIKDGLLGNMSLTNIADEVKSGKMDASRYIDIKNLMTKTVVDTLSKSKTLTQADINTIGYLLDNGATPTQIVTRLGGGSSAGFPGSNGSTAGNTIVNINNSALAGIDFRTPENIDKYKNEASVKYNNPAGLTWGISEELKGMLNSAGVQYGEGGKRPAGEGGNYITFPTVADGVKAYTISLTQRGDDIYSRLYSWSAGGDKNTPEDVKIANKKKYANDMMSQAGIPDGAKFSQLSQEQLGKLMYFQMGKESPGFQKELSKIGFFESLNTPTANASKNYTQDQKNLMDTVTGELTEGKVDILKAGGLSVQDLANYRASMKVKTGDLSSSSTSMKDFTDGEIAQFNSEKYNPQTDKDENRVKRYYDYQSALAKVQADPNASVIDMMRASRGNKSVNESTNKAYKDLGTVVGQLDRMSTKISNYNESKWFGDDFNPIQSIISNKNPWDTKAQEVKAQLNALVPKIARGVFGEVGVLTDSDIERYIQTLPNIKQTADVQDVVQLALLGTIKGSLDNAVSIDSATYDVSGLIGQYKNLDEKIAELKNKVSGNNTPLQVSTNAGTGTYSNSKPTNSYFQPK